MSADNRTFKHLFQLCSHPLPADLGTQSFEDSWVGHELTRYGINGELETAGEADQAQNPQRVVHKGLERLERGSHNLCGHILETSSEVLNLVGVQIVKEGVDGGIAAESVFLGGSEFHLRVAAILSVRLPAKIDKIQIKTKNFDHSSLEMLGLVWVASDVVQATNVIRPDTMLCDGLGLFTVVTHVLGKRDAGHSVDGDVDVVAFNVEQLVTDPAASPTQHDGLGSMSGLVNGFGHVEKQASKLLLARI